MIQLKVRTEYSFGQTFAPIARLVASLKAMGCTAAGIVDTNTWGHVAWMKACQAADIQPLLGAEVIVTDSDEYTPQMWFLATTTPALKELYQTMSLAYQQLIAVPKRGSFPRLYRKDVEAMSKELVKFVGGVTDAAWLRQIGAYADIEPSSGMLNREKKKMGLPLVYTSDNAYMKE